MAGVQVDTVETLGVRQPKVTVAYRFSEPGQPLPLVVPQSYLAGRVIRIPTEPQTVGDHIRRKRLDSKMLQREVAEIVRVDTTSIFNWEANTAMPELRFMPAIIEFLGYNPLPEGTALGDRLVRHRTSLGLSQQEAARQLGVDSSTLARWERGEREPVGAFLDRAKRFLDLDRPSLRQSAYSGLSAQ